MALGAAHACPLAPPGEFKTRSCTPNPAPLPPQRAWAGRHLPGAVGGPAAGCIPSVPPVGGWGGSGRVPGPKFAAGTAAGAAGGFLGHREGQKSVGVCPLGGAHQSAWSLYIVLGHTPRRRRPTGLEQPFKTISAGGLSEYGTPPPPRLRRLRHRNDQKAPRETLKHKWGLDINKGGPSGAGTGTAAGSAEHNSSSNHPNRQPLSTSSNNSSSISSSSKCSDDISTNRSDKNNRPPAPSPPPVMTAPDPQIHINAITATQIVNDTMKE
jgi:hypothetical protein